MRVTKKEFLRLKEELFDSSFMSQKGMWHLMEQRMRDARRTETKKREHVMRLCKAMAAGESWLSCAQFTEQIRDINKRDGKKPNKGVKMEESRMNHEAILGRCVRLSSWGQSFMELNWILRL